MSGRSAWCPRGIGEVLISRYTVAKCLLVYREKVFFLLFSYAALVLAEDEIADRNFLVIIFFLHILCYPIGEEKLWAKQDLFWIGSPVNF